MASAGDVLLFSPYFYYTRNSAAVQLAMKNAMEANRGVEEIQWWPRLDSKEMCEPQELQNNLMSKWKSLSNNAQATGFVCDHDVCGGLCETVVLPTLRKMNIQVMVLGDIQKMAPAEDTPFTYGAGEIYDIDNDNYYRKETSCMGCIQCAVLRKYSKDYEAPTTETAAARTKSAAQNYIRDVFARCHEQRPSSSAYSFMLLGVGTGATCDMHQDFIDAQLMKELGEAAGVSVGLWESYLETGRQPWGNSNSVSPAGPGAKKLKDGKPTEWCPSEEKVLQNCSAEVNNQQCPSAAIYENAAPLEQQSYGRSKGGGAKEKGISKNGRKKGKRRNTEQSKKLNMEQGKSKPERRRGGIGLVKKRKRMGMRKREGSK